MPVSNQHSHLLTSALYAPGLAQRARSPPAAWHLASTSAVMAGSIGMARQAHCSCLLYAHREPGGRSRPTTLHLYRACLRALPTYAVKHVYISYLARGTPSRVAHAAHGVKWYSITKADDAGDEIF